MMSKLQRQVGEQKRRSLDGPGWHSVINRPVRDDGVSEEVGQWDTV